MPASALLSKPPNKKSAFSATSWRASPFLPKMRSIARFMLMFSLGVWVGGIIFFSFVVAPSAFAVLPTSQMAAGIVGVTLTDLHLIGIACGIVFLIASFLLKLRSAKALRSLVTVMLVLSALSLFGIMPQIQRIRSQVGGSI